MKTMEVELLPDLATVQLTIGTKVIGIRTDQVDLLIWALADVRSKMKPEVPLKFPQRKRIHEVQVTSYAVGIDNLSLLPSASLRTEGFGWIKFDFGRDAALEISDALKDCLDEEPDTGAPN
jgi:hypothetical protein